MPIGPTVLAVVDRVVSGLDYLRKDYYDEFKQILMSQAGAKLGGSNNEEVVQRLNESLDKLSRWAFRRG